MRSDSLRLANELYHAAEWGNNRGLTCADGPKRIAFFDDTDRPLRAVRDGEARLLLQLCWDDTAVHLVRVTVMVEFEQIGGDDEATIMACRRSSSA